MWAWVFVEEELERRERMEGGRRRREEEEEERRWGRGGSVEEMAAMARGIRDPRSLRWDQDDMHS